MSIRLFVSEYVSSGAWPEDTLDGSLAQEGKAMLLAIATDFARVPGCEVITTWDTRLGLFPVEEVTAIEVSSPNQADRLFRTLAAESAATFVIAPEFRQILANYRRIVEKMGGRFLGPNLQAIELCADKLATAQHLKQNGIRTVDTLPINLQAGRTEFSYPMVIKPRDGAGSQQTWVVTNHDEFEAVRCEFPNDVSPIQQPFVSGMPVSVGVLLSTDRQNVEVFPPGEQRLTTDDRFHYRGGRIPADLDDSIRQSIKQMVRCACESIDGLSGYVGFDLILDEESLGQPVIVDINPRLTTSYLGYRRLTDHNLTEWLLCGDRVLPAILWQDQPVGFLPNGKPTFQ